MGDGTEYGHGQQDVQCLFQVTCKKSLNAWDENLLALSR
jgi:hypothetical protein